MKINELLKTLKKENSEWAAPNPAILDECGFSDLTYQLPLYEKDCPLKGWHHQDASWICTDTRVGVEFIFLHDEFVGISIRSARKNNIYYQWVSEETYNKVRRWMAEEYLKIRNVELIDFKAEVDMKWIQDYSWHKRND